MTRCYEVSNTRTAYIAGIDVSQAGRASFPSCSPELGVGEEIAAWLLVGVVLLIGARLYCAYYR
jgi:hypothetical protein